MCEANFQIGQSRGWIIDEETLENVCRKHSDQCFVQRWYTVLKLMFAAHKYELGGWPVELHNDFQAL